MAWRAVMLLGACAALYGCGDATGVRPRPRPGADTTAAATTAEVQMIWYDTDPRVLTPNGTVQVWITAKFTEGTHARLVTRNNEYPFTHVGTTWSVVVPESELLEQYRPGNLRHTAGRIEVGCSAMRAMRFI